MEDNKDELFDLDEDFDQQEIPSNVNSIHTPGKEKTVEKQEKKEIKNTEDNLIQEENLETKDNSGQKEKKEMLDQIDNNYKENDEDSNEEKENNEEKEEEENENDQEDSEVESQEKEEELKLNFQERLEKMKSWAIEDDLDISDFSKIENPPIIFPFELDEFQKRSILRLEKHQNVLVCAHTSRVRLLLQNMV